VATRVRGPRLLRMFLFFLHLRPTSYLDSIPLEHHVSQRSK